MTTLIREPGPSSSPTPPSRPSAPQASTGVTAGQLALTFVPFGLGLVFVVWYAELSQDLRLFRTIYTARLALLLSLPALALFPFRDRTPAIKNVWRLTWTFAMLSYAVHAAYGWFGVFGGQLETARLYPDLFHVAPNPTVLDLVVQHQTAPITYSNLAVTALWALDVLVAWVAGGARGAGRKVAVGLHGLTWLAVFVSFAVAAIPFAKNATILVLGWVLVASVALSLVLRAFSPRPAEA